MFIVASNRGFGRVLFCHRNVRLPLRVETLGRNVV